MNLDLSIGKMFKMPTGEVLKIEKINDEDGEFACRLLGLTGEWTNYRIEGKSDDFHKFFTEGGAVFVDSGDYPDEPAEGSV